MSIPENRLFTALTTLRRDVASRTEQQRQQHPTDDHGYPICKCDSCRTVGQSMNARFLMQILSGSTDPERLDFADLKYPQGEFDHDGDGGREYSDFMRANGMGARNAFNLSPGERPTPVAPLPVVADAPSIAASAEPENVIALFPETDTPCDPSPSGQCEYLRVDPYRCIHCGRDSAP